MKLTQRPSPRSRCRPARPTSSSWTTSWPVSATGCASALAAKSFAHGSCNTAMAAPTRRLLLGSADGARCRAGARHGQEGAGPGRQRRGPAGHKLDRRGKDRHTLKATVADYLAIKQREVRPRTYAELVRYLTVAYFKPLHGLALDQITRKDVAARLNRIAWRAARSWPGAPVRAVSAFFVWAMQQAWSRPTRSSARQRQRTASRVIACWRTPSWPQSGRRAVTTITAAASGC